MSAPLDPQLAPLLEQLNAAPPMSDADPQTARRNFRTLLTLSSGMGEPPEVAAIEDLEVPGGDGPIPARLYRPVAEGPVPTLVFFHGGGFVIGDVEGYEGQARLLCHDVGAAVLSVDYRLAPEHPFPAAIDDALTATRWALASVADLGGDPARVAIGGDSAGGNLSAVTAQTLQGEGDGSIPALAAQLLLYPATDFTGKRPSYEANGEGLFLTLDDMLWFEGHYLAEETPRKDPRVSPLLAADLSGLPPAIVATADLDPLRDDGIAYADALCAAGVEVIDHRYDGLIHGFLALGVISEAARAAVEEICADLRKLLA